MNYLIANAASIEIEMLEITIETLRALEHNEKLNGTYKFQNIFFGATANELILGRTILDGSINFEPASLTRPCLTVDNIRPDDIFIKAGTFVKLVKLYYLNPEQPNCISEKYIETNTYSLTHKLGIRLKASLLNPDKFSKKSVVVKRDLIYIKLVESLNYLKQEIIEVAKLMSSKNLELDSSLPALDGTASIISVKQHTLVSSEINTAHFQRSNGDDCDSHAFRSDLRVVFPNLLAKRKRDSCIIPSSCWTIEQEPQLEKNQDFKIPKLNEIENQLFFLKHIYIGLEQKMFAFMQMYPHHVDLDTDISL